MATDLHALLLCIIVALQVLFGLIWLFTRRGPDDSSTLKLLSEDLRASETRLEAALNRGVQAQREDASTSARNLRGELNSRFDALQQASGQSAAELRKEVAAGLDRFRTSLGEMSDSQDKRFSDVRNTLDAKVKELQESNERKLEEMRKTVDEKLQGTLEKRLGESFKLVSERLDTVHKGLGEMQTLANGVGDLKRLMSNVKARGTWGEMQLGALLENFLAPDQYAMNVEAVEGSGERVEFAIQLPGQDAASGRVWLPVDAKFPHEDYLRLAEAEDRADAEAVASARKGLDRAVRAAAKDIARKYLNPPKTTDFAILFVPTESLYAELLRTPNLAGSLQQEHKVLLAGPTTLAALLNSLQMGFRTLAIQKRSSEVWEVLGAVKTEFGKFGGVLDKVQKKLDEATKVMENAKTRSRAMQRKLRNVESLPEPEAAELLGIEEPEEIGEGASA